MKGGIINEQKCDRGLIYWPLGRTGQVMFAKRTGAIN